MPRPFARPSAVLSAFPVSRYSTLDRTTQRETHDVLRQSVERLWHPFTSGRRGVDLKAYRFSEHLAELCTPGTTFTCQVNGVAGGKKVLEDFFAILIAGFDIVQVNVESARGSSVVEDRDLCNYRGFYVLEHTRPFLGWVPTPTSLSLSAACAGLSTDYAAIGAPTVNSIGAAYTRKSMETAERSFLASTQLEKAAAADTTSSTLAVPFSTYVEGIMDSGRLSHLVLRSPVMELLSSCAQCPKPVRQCLLNKEALKMFSTLRRAGVKPGVITAKTLLSASKQNEVWTAALGIL